MIKNPRQRYFTALSGKAAVLKCSLSSKPTLKMFYLVVSDLSLTSRIFYLSLYFQGSKLKRLQQCMFTPV